MSGFILKLIAMSSMLIDHIAIGFVSDTQFLMRNIGRLAFVIYAFLIAEGFYHIKNDRQRVNRHLLKILLLAIVSEIPLNLFEYNYWTAYTGQNAIWTLLLGFCVLFTYEYIKGRVQKKTVAYLMSAAIATIVAIVAFRIKSEYGFAGVLLIAMFYLYLQKADVLRIPQKVLSLLIIEGAYVLLYLWSCTRFGTWANILNMGKGLIMNIYGVTAAFLLLAFYNRKLGYHSKWFSWLYSIFYPLQFVVLLVARYFIRGF